VKELVPYEAPPSKDDAEFSVTIKVRNNRFLAALHRSGYRSVNAFCKRTKLPQSQVNEYATMTRSPYRRDGRPTELAQLVADSLGALVEDLFPARFLSRCLDRVARTEIAMTEDQLGYLLQNAPRTPEQVLLMDEAAAQVSDALRLLPPREERVLRLRHGMGLRDEKTFEQVGEQLNVSRERVRQMESKALRMMNAPSRRSRLISAADTLEVGQFVSPPPNAVTPQSVGIRPAPPSARYGPPRPPKEPEARRVNRPVRFPPPQSSPRPTPMSRADGADVAPQVSPPPTQHSVVTFHRQVTCPHCGAMLFFSFREPPPDHTQASCWMCRHIFPVAA
jgi:RNA polymerase sigma factor (sigma-70 family)